ncbi:Tubulin polyglutamylase TTLL11 [Toxocara canis]|uniref:Tubulin polyglutamylase TTLL11 n=1 Tax=Toxocara canis TaxID=6265 RepID=A0A0B2V1A1_TOXCA|nr:Tubulin polyglutamylase TTLL11 [Toxocara canis]
MGEHVAESNAKCCDSPQHVIMSRSTGRLFTIDTSRAKTNAQVVSLCAQKLGIKEFPEGRSDGKPCDIYWHSIVYNDMKAVVNDVNARVNKFPGMTELSKKISLTRAIASMRRLFPNEYEFYPKSWFIPAQLDEFCEHCKRTQMSTDDDTQSEVNWYIVKPDDGAQGTGIYLINSPAELKDTTSKQLIQEYVSDPFLLGDSLKFDFRVYAVIKSINPLSIYVAREGMARFCTEKYSKPSVSNVDNLYAHLTNYSLNKANGHYVHSSSLQDQLRGGSKRLLSTVFHQMEARGVKTKRLWHNIKLIIVKTIFAMLPEIMLCYEHYFYDAPGPRCFQVIGFDILVTRQVNPILLEVNSAPSLTIDHSLPIPNEDIMETVEPPRVRSIVDEVIKIPLVMDTILLVLDLIDDVYSARSFSTTSVLSDRINCVKSTDDMFALTMKKKSHLSEIFPCRYGQCSGHLLFLDKAVYLFMHFVNLKRTSCMTISGARTFVKKCNLTDVIKISDLERKFDEIYCHFTGERQASIPSGKSIHLFLCDRFAYAVYFRLCLFFSFILDEFFFLLSFV